jgi:predicted lactoylglutathione lyase
MSLSAEAGRRWTRRDHGFMYASSFNDLDGHHWEVFWMDPATQQEAQ